MDVSRETHHVTTKPKCYDLANILVRWASVSAVRKTELPVRRDSRGAACPTVAGHATLHVVARGKILHTRNHKSEIPLENATEHPLAISRKIHWGSDTPLENATDK